ncbi:MAG: VWA domain-containing protein [Promethearchaeota archaeon]
MNKKHFGIWVIFLGSCLLLSQQFLISPVVGLPASSNVEPDSVSVWGTIEDNYAEIVYELIFDQTSDVEDEEMEWDFGIEGGIRLSNVSIQMGNTTYYGAVKPIQEAIDDYNQSVDENKTALLIRQIYGGYKLNINLKAGEVVRIQIFFEGLLIRNLGEYKLELPLSLDTVLLAPFYLNLTLQSHFSPIAGMGLRGLTGYTLTDIAHGTFLEYTSSGAVYIPADLEIIYRLGIQSGGSQLLSYTNGTTNFFTYLLAPVITDLGDISEREFVFVLDISGSMSGTPITQAKIAFTAMIEELHEGDRFNIITFESEVSSLWESSEIATGTRIDEAQTWVSGLEAGGSTNFHGACMTGLDSFSTEENVKIMMVLSDGVPTAGDTTNPSEIITAVDEANELDASISTIAFGSGADITMMSEIASRNQGFYVFIDPEDDAVTELLDFYSRFSVPIADDYSISLTGAYHVAAHGSLSNSPFFNGSEIIISGQYEGSVSIDTIIEYYEGTETYQNIATTPTGDLPHVERIWAQMRISHLLRGKSTLTELEEQEIISIAMYYGLVVEDYTAMILVVEDEINDELTKTESFIDYYDGDDDSAFSADKMGTIPFYFNWGILVSGITLFEIVLWRKRRI